MVGINQKSVEIMRDDFFKEPTAWPAEHPLRVAVPSDISAVKLKRLQGSMQRYSPEEVDHAFIAAVARDIRRGEPQAVLELRPQL